MSEIGLLSTFISSIALFAIGVFVALPTLARKKSTTRGSDFFVLLCFSASLWIGANTFSDTDPVNALFWVRVSFVSITVSIFSFLMFVNRFPQPRFTSVKENIFHTSIFIFMLCLISTDFFIPQIEFDGAISTVVPGSLYLLFFPYLIYAFTLAVYRLAKVGSSRLIHRSQARLILIGIAIPATVATMTNFILPLFLMRNDLYWVAAPAVLSFVVATAYSIAKQRLFDIRAAFSRTVAYIGAVIVIGVALGVIVSEGVRRLNLSGDDLQLAMIFATVVVALIYPPIKMLFDTLTERIFYRKEYDVQDAINEITEVFAKSNTLDQLLKNSTDALKRFMGSEFVAIVFDPRTNVSPLSSAFGLPPGKDNLNPPSLLRTFKMVDGIKVVVADELGSRDKVVADEMDKTDIAIVGQLRSPTGLIGYIIIGYKQNGKSYVQRDVDLVDTVSDEFAIAIQNMLRLQEILKLNQGLKDKIDGATQELRNSNKKLKQIDQTKDEFISLTSHQLRTPLTTIKGYVSMLLDGDAGELKPQQRKLLEEAFNSSQRMAHLISDFLNISRIQTGNFQIEMTEVNLAAILDDEIDQLRTSALSRQIDLIYDMPENFPLMQIDESKIRQVMMNFIDNALYYSPPNTKVVVILSQIGNVIEFKVVDHGIGVPAAEQHKLFSKFARASNARKQRPDGTGIGLFMAKKVVVALGGAIIFESKENQGSTFGFRLNRI